MSNQDSYEKLRSGALSSVDAAVDESERMLAHVTANRAVMLPHRSPAQIVPIHTNLDGFVDTPAVPSLPFPDLLERMHAPPPTGARPRASPTRTPAKRRPPSHFFRLIRETRPTFDVRN